MRRFMEWMDNDPFAAIVLVTGMTVTFFVIVAVAERIHNRPRRFDDYDGGCKHSPWTCWYCEHGVNPPD